MASVTENTEYQDRLPAAEAQHEAAQASDTKAEAKASDELSEDEIKAFVGGVFRATLLKADLGD
jgi:hypothetical protein